MTKMRQFLVLAAAWPAAATETRSESNANPIRKVVTMLQSMQKKIQKEGDKEEELYEKFMCYCKTGKGELSSSIAAAEEKIPAVSSSIESAEAKLAQSKEDLKSAQADRSDAKKAMADATALREKEASAFAKEKADADANVAAIAKATAAIENGMGGSFLQTPAASILKRAVSKTSLADADRQELLAFLSSDSRYAPQSGEIVGILKQMGDEMAGDRASAIAAEKEAIASYEGLMAAKKKEVAATTATVESKTKQIGELGVALVEMKDDHADTEASLEEDKKFLAELSKGCETKTGEWKERSATRAAELVALGDTIKVLNDDDALDLFKKTLPSASASFVQVQVTEASTRAKAMSALRVAKARANKNDRAGLELLSLALAGKSTRGFNCPHIDKVIKMIDGMVAVLKKEQVDDDAKKEYCATQFDESDDKKKAFQRTVQSEENAIATTEEGISTLTEEIAALTAGIKDLDKSVAEATEQRKEENADYKALMASDGAAVELLNFAKNRLNKFYNPDLNKPAPKVELSREDRIYKNMGNPDDLVTTEAPGGIADSGITALVQTSSRRDAPAPPPATWDAYAKKGQEGNGVIAMINLLIKDLEKEMTTAEADEKNAQANYEEMTKDAAEKRRTDSQALSDKGGAKADLEGELQEHKQAHKGAVKELMATDKYIASLHAECDWLVKYHDTRKEARADEVDSLHKAKAVLSGADYSLVQTGHRAFLRRA